MARLIDANALVDSLESTNIRLAPDKGKMFKLIEDAPTVDAVEVVRCKDCWAYDPEDGKCTIRSTADGFPLYVLSTGYCSEGERREDYGC
jgi:Pyruvate/2-oxoacid:ferredoxin oxidoreductase delta subunit